MKDKKVYVSRTDLVDITKALYFTAMHADYRAAMRVIEDSTAVGTRTKRDLSEEIKGKLDLLPKVMIIQHYPGKGLSVELNGVECDYDHIDGRYKSAIFPDDIGRAEAGEAVLIILGKDGSFDV